MEVKNNFKAIGRIALMELNTMFYSPIAWLLLVIFAFQVGFTFSSNFDGYLKSLDMGRELYSVSAGLFSQFNGVLISVTEYMFLYIPLITMGLMSREYASGSIKLLYSSPISSESIVFGKFLAMMIYGAALTLVLLGYVVFAGLVVENFDWSYILTGVLGIYLLLCAYSAIGLFMSSLTSYQVVAALGTLALLAVLNMIKNVGQNIEFVREITYWFSISGRVDTFIDGLISSEGVIYFLTVIGLFLTLTILKLGLDRQKKSLVQILLRYAAVVAVTVLLGYVSTRPALKVYRDMTFSQDNTLTYESRQIMSRLTGPTTITTYVNLLDENFYSGLPINRNSDEKRFERYLRFNPHISMKYVYYYDKTYNPNLYERHPNMSDEEIGSLVCQYNDLNFKMFMPPSEIKKIIDLKPEGNRFVRVVERQGKKTYLRIYDDQLRHPNEEEISGAFRRLVDTLPKVAVVGGHNDRRLNNYGDRGYYSFASNLRFRNSLPNQGFDVSTIDLTTQEIAEDVNIVILADLKTPLSELEKQRLDQYIDRGGNLLILGDRHRQSTMNEIVKPLGVQFMEGVLVRPSTENEASVIPACFTPEATAMFRKFKFPSQFDYRLSMPAAVALQYDTTAGFDVVPLFRTEPTGVWIQPEPVDFVDGQFDSTCGTGYQQQAYATYLLLSRKVNGREQRIAVSGDADIMSNGELWAKRAYSSANFTVLTTTFRWLSYDKFPVYADREEKIDNALSLPIGVRKPAKAIGTLALGGILLIFSLILISLRKRK